MRHAKIFQSICPHVRACETNVEHVSHMGTCWRELLVYSRQQEEKSIRENETMSKAKYMSQRTDSAMSVIVWAERLTAHIFSITSNEKQFPKSFRYTLSAEMRNICLKFNEHLYNAAYGTNHSGRVATYNGSAQHWWTSTAFYSSYVWYVGSGGTAYGNGPGNSRGFRPCVAVKRK